MSVATRPLLAACLALSLGSGCRGKEQAKSARCEIVSGSVREVGGALEVAVSVRWTVGDRNYRTNKPVTYRRFDPAQHSLAELEKEFAPGQTVACAIDPAHPTRIDLKNR